MFGCIVYDVTVLEAVVTIVKVENPSMSLPQDSCGVMGWAVRVSSSGAGVTARRSTTIGTAAFLHGFRVAPAFVQT